MKHVSIDAFRKLSVLQDRRCVSIQLPTERAGEGTQQGPIRLKNLLGRAQELLVERGTRAPEARELLEPVARRIDDALFWQHQSDGLAIFVAPGVLEELRVPIGLEELAVVGPRFHIKPLLPLLANDGRFFVLALSRKHVRLLECTRHVFAEVELQDTPHSIAEALKHDDPEQHLEYHSGTSVPPAATPSTTPQGGRNAPEVGRRAPMYHGQGGIKDTEKPNLLRFFQKVDRGVRKTLDGDASPVVLAGVEYLLPLYREASNHPRLLDGALTGNPDKVRVRDEELHQAAWRVVEPLFAREREKVRAHFFNLTGTGLATTDLATIVRAAHGGKVESFLVAPRSEAWGRFDEKTSEVRVEEGANGDTAEREDLLNLATVLVIRHGGTVYSLEPDELPDGPAAAILRR